MKTIELAFGLWDQILDGGWQPGESRVEGGTERRVAALEDPPRAHLGTGGRPRQTARADGSNVYTPEARDGIDDGHSAAEQAIAFRRSVEQENSAGFLLIPAAADGVLGEIAQTGVTMKDFVVLAMLGGLTIQRMHPTRTAPEKPRDPVGGTPLHCRSGPVADLIASWETFVSGTGPLGIRRGPATRHRGNRPSNDAT